MDPDDRLRGGGPYAFLLAALAVVAFALCAAYAVVTPIFQQQDEWAHLDYDLALFQNGGVFWVAHGKEAAPATTDGAYLVDKLSYRRFRYDPDARLAPGYASAAYRAAVDRGAPGARSWKPCDGCAVPYAASIYPVTAYALDAAVLLGLEHFFGAHVFEDILVLRLLHALLVVPLIVCAYVIFRMLGSSRLDACLAAGGVAFFPTTMMLFSYVQPDALVTVLTTAALYFALRVRRATLPNRWLWLLTAALACDTLVKPVYGIIAAIALCIALFAGRTRDRGRAWAPALPLLVSLAMLVLSTRLYIVGKIIDAPATVISSVDRSVPAMLAAAMHAVADIYSGVAFRTYWYKDGLWMSNTFVPQNIVPVLKIVIGMGSLAVAVSVLAWMYVRIRTGVRTRASAGAADAVRDLLSDPALALYGGWTVSLVAVDAYLGNNLGLVGRYWAPVMVPTVALATVYAARPFAQRYRRTISTVCAVVWFVAAVSLNASAFANTISRFYEPSRTTEPKSFIVLESIVDARGNPIDALRFQRSRNDTLTFSGWGLDSQRGLPGSGAEIVVDGISKRIDYGEPMSPRANGLLHDFSVEKSGFRATLRLATLRPGVHHVGFAIVDADGRTREAWSHELTITIVAAPAARHHIL